MNIDSFKYNNFVELSKSDITCRNIGYSYINDCCLTGTNSFYPNVLITNIQKKILISPYDETILSLNKSSFYDNNIYVNDEIMTINNTILTPVFFYIYNFDNYYHFIYDTLPYLHTYLILKKNIKNLKLLVNFPNISMDHFYDFNMEILKKLIDINDIIIHSKNNIYSILYISTSLTHGGVSNNAPRREIYYLYEKMVSAINYSNISSKYIGLKNIYISRRTWINNKTDNIGTNYTTRRKMINEDDLVEFLKKNNFIEIFAENLNIDEKMYLFSHSETIIGTIGGGMTNALFSKPTTSIIVIETPFFLQINKRFIFAIQHTNVKYFRHTSTYFENNNKIPLYSRVKININMSIFYNKIGEIYDFIDDKYYVNISNNDISGFNNNICYNTDLFKENELLIIDPGLNSPYVIDQNKFNELIF